MNRSSFLLMLCFLFCGEILFAQAPLRDPYSNEAKINYLRTYESFAPFRDPVEMLTRPRQDVLLTAEYVDGLGRPLQKILRQGAMVTGQTPKDLVSYHMYDSLGQEVYQYMPYVSNSRDGLFKYDPFVQQKDFYNLQLAGQPGETLVGPNGLNWAYSKRNYEPSPLYRTQSEYSPGTSWVGSEQTASRRNISTGYWINTSEDSVRIWTVSGWNGFSANARYAAGELFKTIETDEKGVQTISFKDKKGQLILKKTQLLALPDNGTGKGHWGWICTYFIYDEMLALRGRVQPEGVEKMRQLNNWTPASAILDDQMYIYAYDTRQRLQRKKIPGVQETYCVYDKWNRLVLVQDANKRSSRQWLYTKYDMLGRAVVTGMYTHPTVLSVEAMQAYANAQNKAPFETRNTTIPGYTLNASFPETNASTVFTATYYDNYDWVSMFSSHAANYGVFDQQFNASFLTPNNNQFPYPQSLVQSTAVTGLETGSYANIGSGLVRSMIYDSKGRVIQVKSRNWMSGNDILTTQYDFSAKPLRILYKNSIGGQSPQSHILCTNYQYDDLGRLLSLRRSVVSRIPGITDTVKAPEILIARNSYDALGHLKRKDLGQQRNRSNGTYAADPVDSLVFDYNIRGWVLGVNRSFLQTGAGDKNYFGFELGYDKTNAVAGRDFQQKQYNGDISGVVWKTSGDGVQRKYDYRYDAVNRLLSGEFEQNDESSGWGRSIMDFSSRVGTGTSAASAYDLNGNIRSLSHHGMNAGGKVLLDSLIYTYLSGTNKLLRVQDLITVNNRMADFTDSNTTDDYGYDLNGNLITDMNKGLRGSTGHNLQTGGAITYNHLNLPDSIPIKSKSGVLKGSVKYIYNYDGAKILKRVIDKTIANKTITTITYYLGDIEYESRSISPVDPAQPDYVYKLKHINHPEGRIRMVDTTGGIPPRLTYDFFEKDHLGNVRVMLSEDRQLDIYPIATLEGDPGTGGVALAKKFYEIDNAKIVDKSLVTGFPVLMNNNSPVPTRQVTADSNQVSQKLYKLQALGSTAVTGLSTTLRVMGGDKVSLFGKSYFHDANTSGANYAVPVLTLLTSFIGAPSGAALNKGVSAAQLNGIPEITTALEAFRDDPDRNPSTSNIPKAALNWILFDEQFRPVSSCMGFKKVSQANVIESLNQIEIEIPRNGYLFIYCSNQSPVSVFFDNFQVVHDRSPLLEETHYYPFGLTIAAISSKSAGFVENRYHYNAKEKQDKELADGTGLEWYDYGARMYDAQIGRWHVVDPANEKYPENNPYMYCANSPINYFDPDGKDYYRNNITNEVVWYNGAGSVAGHEYLGAKYTDKAVSDAVGKHIMEGGGWEAFMSYYLNDKFGEAFFFDASSTYDDNARGKMRILLTVLPVARVAMRLSMMTHEWVGNPIEHPDRNRMEHYIGMFLMASRYGGETARKIGLANEMRGLFINDRNAGNFWRAILGRKAANGGPTAFEYADLKYNELGINRFENWARMNPLRSARSSTYMREAGIRPLQIVERGLKLGMHHFFMDIDMSKNKATK